MMKSSRLYLRHLDNWVRSMRAQATAASPTPPPAYVDVSAALVPSQPVQAEALNPEKAPRKKRSTKGVKCPQKVIQGGSSVLLLGFGLSLLVSSCVTTRPVHRTEVMARAESYLQHRWYATRANVRHGVDSNGIRVDTPDAGFHPTDGGTPGWWQPGAWNTGMPYQWGGFDTLTEFDRKVQRGLAAGDVYTLVKRAGLDAAVSQEACGIDCSGFISRCWGLKRSVSTRELPSLCERLASYDDLRPGDIVNTHNSHVLLFAGWADAAHEKVQVYEAGSRPEWKVLRRTLSVAFLRQKGYVPLRYRSMRD